MSSTPTPSKFHLFIANRLNQTLDMLKPFFAFWQTLSGNLRGGILILWAALFFSISVVLIKWVGQRLHITQILFIRQILLFIIISPLLLSDLRNCLKTKRPGLQSLRIILASVAMLSGFQAIIYLPLAEAASLGFSKALFVTVFAVPFLGEVIGLRRAMATVVGFIGVLIMLQPGDTMIDPYYAGLSLLSAACAGLVMVVLRILSQSDTPTTIMTYQAIFVGLIMMPLAIYYWQTPNLTEIIFLIAIGITGYLAQFCNIHAFKNGEASAIIPLDYSRLIYSTFFSIVFFSQWPQIETFLGAGLIIVASIYTLHRERSVSKQMQETKKNRPYSPDT